LDLKRENLALELKKPRNKLRYPYILLAVMFMWVYVGLMRSTYEVLVGKPKGKRPLGRPSCRW